MNKALTLRQLLLICLALLAGAGGWYYWFLNTPAYTTPRREDEPLYQTAITKLVISVRRPPPPPPRPKGPPTDPVVEDPRTMANQGGNVVMLVPQRPVDVVRRADGLPRLTDTAAYLDENQVPRSSAHGLQPVVVSAPVLRSGAQWLWQDGRYVLFVTASWNLYREEGSRQRLISQGSEGLIVPDPDDPRGEELTERYLQHRVAREVVRIWRASNR